MTEYLTVKNWENFQHYKDRNPPWIKLHIELVNSEDWIMLDDAGKLLAIVCMMIASRNQGKVPNNPTYLKKVAHLDKLPNLKPLIEAGFLVDASTPLADASMMLANASKLQADARIEERRGEKIRGEDNTLILPDWLPLEDWNDYLAMRTRIKKKPTPRAIELLLKELEKWKNQGEDISAIIQNSIKNSYVGLFLPNKTFEKKQKVDMSWMDKYR